MQLLFLGLSACYFTTRLVGGDGHEGGGCDCERIARDCGGGGGGGGTAISSLSHLLRLLLLLCLNPHPLPCSPQRGRARARALELLQALNQLIPASRSEIFTFDHGARNTHQTQATVQTSRLNSPTSRLYILSSRPP